MLKHYGREFRNKDIRENIDKDLTKYNYNLAPCHEGQSDYEFLKKRLSEVKHINRADINVMADWVVTLPKDYKDDEEKFFQTMYKGLASRYGEQNVISAWVHKDEPQAKPHMHFCFMPVHRDYDKDEQEIDRLNAKKVLSRTELTRIHGEMEKYMERNHCPCHLLNGATREGNKSIEQLKEEQAIKDLEAVNLYRQVQKDIVEPVKPVVTLKGKVVPYQQYEHDINVLNSRLMRQRKQIEKTEQERDRLKDNYGQALNDIDKKKKELEERNQYIDKCLWDKHFLKEQLKEVERFEHETLCQHEHTRTRNHDIDR